VNECIRKSGSEAEDASINNAFNFNQNAKEPK